MTDRIRIVQYNNIIDSYSKRRLKTPIKKDEKEENLAICRTFFIIIKENYLYTNKKLIDIDNNEENKNNLPSENCKKEIKEEVKLICQKCGESNKSLYKCFDCDLILCQNCKEESRHDKLIEYELFNIITQYQLEKFTSYCQKCKINLDENSKSNHKTHSIKTFKDLKKDINLKELKQKISEIKEKIDNIVDKLN